MPKRYLVTFYGEVGPDEWSFGVPSRTRKEITHECSVHLLSGVWFCTCEWATLSGLNRDQPTMLSLGMPCWHCRRVVTEAGWICKAMERGTRKVLCLAA